MKISGRGLGAEIFDGTPIRSNINQFFETKRSAK